MTKWKLAMIIRSPQVEPVRIYPLGSRIEFEADALCRQRPFLQPLQ
jgi:hypothetical protein